MADSTFYEGEKAPPTGDGGPTSMRLEVIQHADDALFHLEQEIRRRRCCGPRSMSTEDTKKRMSDVVSTGDRVFIVASGSLHLTESNGASKTWRNKMET
mmetsp:Transcript_38782/g.84037  ORF Transcript_38782/g.84037 Transcript_38782/m.84037 type:complete len:99 (+) Transcript_38782:214-510(+)